MPNATEAQVQEAVNAALNLAANRIREAQKAKQVSGHCNTGMIQTYKVCANIVEACKKPVPESD